MSDNVAFIGETGYETLRAAVNAVKDGETIDFVTTAYADATVLASDDNIAFFNTPGTYTLVNGQGAFFNYELEVNGQKNTDQGWYNLVIGGEDKTSWLTLTKMTLRPYASLTITNSTVDFQAFQSGCSYLSAYGNAVLTITGSTVGNKSAGHTGVDNFYGPRMAVYGTATVTNSTLYTGIGQGADALDVSGNGQLTMTDSTLNMSFMNIGNQWDSEKFIGEGADNTTATVTLSNTTVNNTQYWGDLHGCETVAIYVGDDAGTHKGNLQVTNGSVVDLTKSGSNILHDIEVNTGSTMSIDGSTVNAVNFTNSGTVNVSGVSKLSATSYTGDLKVTDATVTTDGFTQVSGTVEAFGTSSMTGFSFDTVEVGFDTGSTTSDSLTLNGVDYTLGLVYVGQDTDSDRNYTLTLGGTVAGMGVIYNRYNGTLNITDATVTNANSVTTYGAINLTNSTVDITAGNNFYIAGRSDKLADGKASVSLNNSTLTLLNPTGGIEVGCDTGTGSYNKIGSGVLTLTNNSLLHTNHLTLCSKNANITGDIKVTVDNSKIQVDDYEYPFDGDACYGAIAMYAGSELEIVVGANSSITTGTFTNDGGTITVDMTNATGAFYKLVDATGTSSYGTYSFVTGADNGYTLSVIDNDLFATKIDYTHLVVDADWTDKTLGEAITIGDTTYYYGFNAFNNLADAAAAAPNGQATTLLVQGDTAILAESAFGGGRDVTITGNASFDWNSGSWMMVGRDAGTHGDVSKLAKITFDGATIARQAGKGGGDHSIHISGAEKDSTSKGYGQMDVINGSNVTTEWVIDKNVLNVNTKSTLNILGGLNVAGRPASETPSGEDYTSYLNVDDATVNVGVTYTGMSIGSEGNGVVNLTNGAVLNSTYADGGITATAKSTINMDDSTLTASTFTNDGTLNITGVSKLSATSYTGAINIGSTEKATTLTTDGLTAYGNVYVKDGSTVTLSGDGFVFDPNLKGTSMFIDSASTYNESDHTGYTLNIQNADAFKTYGFYVNGGSTVNVTDVVDFDGMYFNIYGGVMNLSNSGASNESTNITGTLNVTDKAVLDTCFFNVSAASEGYQAGTANITDATVNATHTLKVGTEVRSSTKYYIAGTDQTARLNLTKATVTANDAANAGVIEMDDSTLTASTFTNTGTLNITGTSKLSATSYTGAINIGSTEKATTLTTDGLNVTGGDLIVKDGSTVTLSGNGFDLLTGEKYIYDSVCTYNENAHEGYTLNIQDADLFKVYAIYANGGSTVTVTDVTKLDSMYLNIYGGVMTLSNSTAEDETTNVTGTLNVTNGAVLDTDIFNINKGLDGKQAGVVNVTNATVKVNSSFNLSTGTRDAKYYIAGTDQTARMNLSGATLNVKCDPLSNAGVLTIAAASTVTAAAVANTGSISITDSTLTVTGTVTNSSTIAMDADSTITAAAIANTGSITVDVTGATGVRYKLVDYTGTGTMTLDDYGTVTLTSTDDSSYKLWISDNDLYAVNATLGVEAIVVDDDWAGKDFGATVEVGGEPYYYGISAFADTAAALAGADATTTDIQYNAGTYTGKYFENNVDITFLGAATMTGTFGAYTTDAAGTENDVKGAALSTEYLSLKGKATLNVYNDITVTGPAGNPADASAWIRANTVLNIMDGGSVAGLTQLSNRGVINVEEGGELGLTWANGSGTNALAGTAGTAGTVNVYGTIKAVDGTLVNNDFPEIKQPQLTIAEGDGYAADAISKVNVMGGTFDAKTSTLTIGAKGQLNLSEQATAELNIISNAGAVTADASSLTVNDTLTNSGTITAEDATVTVKNLTNTGAITATGSTITVSGTLNTTGTFTMDETSRLILATADWTGTITVDATGATGAYAIITTTGDGVFTADDIAKLSLQNITGYAFALTGDHRTISLLKEGDIPVTPDNPDEETYINTKDNGFISNDLTDMTKDVDIDNQGTELDVLSDIETSGDVTITNSDQASVTEKDETINLRNITAEGVTISHEGGNDLEVNAENINATGDVVIKNTTKDSDLETTVNVNSAANLTIQNETNNTLSHEGELNVTNIFIVNNSDTADSKAGDIAIANAIAATGAIVITNGNTASTQSGTIDLGTGTHTAGAGLTITNQAANVINGGTLGEIEQAANFNVTGDATITNNGHINANVKASGTVTITNTSMNTLIGDISAADIVINAAASEGLVKDSKLTATNSLTIADIQTFENTDMDVTGASGTITLAANADVTMDIDSTITAANGSFTFGSGAKLTIDAGDSWAGHLMVIDLKAGTDLSACNIVTNDSTTYGTYADADNGDLYIYKKTYWDTDYHVDDGWASGKTAGEILESGVYYSVNGFGTIQEAVNAAEDKTATIAVAAGSYGDVTIADGNDANLDFILADNVTFTGLLTNNGSVAQELTGETSIWDNDAIKDFNEDTAWHQDLLIGSWQIEGDAIKVVTDSSTTASVALGGSFENANGKTLWLGSNGGKTGVTSGIITLDSAATASELSYYNFADMASIASTYTDYDGIINVEGSTFTSHLYAGKATLNLQGAITLKDSYLVYGARNANTRDEDKSITIDQKVTAKGLYAGDHYTSAYTGGNVTAGTDSTTVTLDITNATDGTDILSIGGGNLITAANGQSFEYTYGTTTITVGADVTSRLTVGGSIVGGVSAVTETGDISMTLSAGEHKYVAAGGYILSSGASLTHVGNISLTIDGGTYRGIYGGIAGDKAAYTANAMIQGDVSITIDTTGSKTVSMKYLFAGNSGLGDETLQGNTTVTFTGLGANLSFTDAAGGVNGGNALKSTYTTAWTGTTRTLAFNDFTGKFRAPYVESFDTIAISNGSEVEITSLYMDLATVKTWEFETGTSLEWRRGTNDFTGDTLSFGTTASDEEWTAFSVGSETMLKGWDNWNDDDADKVTKVYIYGVAATWDDDAEAWTTSTHKLSAVDGSLVVSTLA